MKKIYTLLPVLFLAACVQTENEYQQNDFYNDETTFFSEDDYAFEDDVLIVDKKTGLVADENPVGVESKTQSIQPVVQPSPSPVATETTEITVSEDGTKIIIPAQEIYIGDKNSVVSANVKTRPVMAYSSADVIPQESTSEQPKKQAWITLQNPKYPNTFVQCAFGDMGCVALHEQQGYVRVQGLPHFAGYQDILGSSDYPGDGQWRNGNNIPRW